MAAAAPAPAINERRGSSRYPLILQVHYRTEREQEYRAGMTVNIAPQGVLFRTAENETIPIRTQLTVEISWPVMLDGNCPLKLVMAGRVVWSADGRCAIRVTTHEFKTAAKRSQKGVTSVLDYGTRSGRGGQLFRN